MAGKQRYTKKQITDALNACNGLTYLAAERLGCTSDTICNYKKRYPEIEAAVLERRGRRVDIAEAKLDTAVLAGERWAIEFTLRTLGKDRGFTEKQEHEHTGASGGPIQVQVYIPSNDRDRPAITES